jgi:hypothetical protein
MVLKKIKKKETRREEKKEKKKEEMKKKRETQGVCIVWDLLTWMSSESSAKY